MVAVSTKPEGLGEVLRNLNIQIEKIEKNGIAGVWDAGLQIQGLSQKEVPVEYGILRASAYTRTIGKLRRLDTNIRGNVGEASEHLRDPPGMLDKFTVEIGYSALYSVFVHENMEQTLKGQPRESGLGTYWNPGGPKFLENPIRRNVKDILEIIRRRAQIKRM